MNMQRFVWPGNHLAWFYERRNRDSERLRPSTKLFRNFDCPSRGLLRWTSELLRLLLLILHKTFHRRPQTESNYGTLKVTGRTATGDEREAVRILKNASSPLTASRQLSSSRAADHRLVKVQIITSPIRRDAICMNKPPSNFGRLPSPFPENYTFLLWSYTSPPCNYPRTRSRLNFIYTLIRYTDNCVRFKYDNLLFLFFCFYLFYLILAFTSRNTRYLHLHISLMQNEDRNSRAENYRSFRPLIKGTMFVHITDR